MGISGEGSLGFGIKGNVQMVYEVEAVCVSRL